MLKVFDPKALAGHPAVVPALLIACFFGFPHRFFLAEAYLPVHDTADVFHVFKTTYANFAATGEIPEWLPHGVYGYAAHLQNLLGLSPMSYPVMALGKLFGAGDALVLFKTVILLEIAVFSFGFLRLADELFENRAVSLMALAPLLMTTVVINQIYFSFRLVYLLPLLTFFILRFFRTGRARHAVMAAVVFFASVYGNLVYFTLYYALYGGLLSGLLIYVYRKDFRLVAGRVSAAALGLTGLAALFIGVGVTLILTATDELTFVVTDRDPVTLKVDLDNFLDYGHGGIVKMFEMLLARPLSTFDATFFVPAAALVFAIYALCREREPVFLAFVAVFTFFLVLAWGRYSPLAYMVYYLPGASYFRHLGLTYAVPKVLICLIAGFGVRHFLAATAAGGDAYHKERRFLAAIAWLGVFAITVVLAAALFVVGNLDGAALGSGLELLSAAGFLAAAAVAATPALARKTLLGTLAAVIVVQGGIYLVLVNALFTDGYTFEPTIKQEVVRARPYAFEATRLPVPDHPRYRTWNAFDPWRYFYQSHTILYGSLGMDPCTPVIPRNLVDNYSPGVDALARHLLGPDAGVGKFGDYYARDPDALFFRLAGCRPAAKLQLIGGFEERPLEPGPPITPEAMASALMVERPDTGERRLVTSTAGEHLGAASLAEQGIAVTHFSANRLEITVGDKAGTIGPKGAWLVYADAFHPGWRAAVDGRPAPVWRANLAFKAVFLPPGTTAVGFDFTHPWRQAAYWFTALVSLAAMVLGCLPGAAKAFMPRRPGAINDQED